MLHANRAFCGVAFVAEPSFAVKIEICKVEHIPAVHAVVKIKNCDVAVCHVYVIVAVAVVKMDEAVGLIVSWTHSCQQ